MENQIQEQGLSRPFAFIFSIRSRPEIVLQLYPEKFPGGKFRKQFKEVIVLEIVIVAIGAMIIGVAIGFSIGKAKYYQWPIGDLRVDQSDPDSPPQLFLELDKDVPAVMTKKYVAFRVKVEDFIPHE